MQVPQSTAHNAEVLARGEQNGRHTLFTLIAFISFSFVLLLGSLQTAHGWPVAIKDGAYACYLGVLALTYFWLYRT